MHITVYTSSRAFPNACAPASRLLRTSQLLLPVFCAIQTRCFFIAVLLVENAVRAAYGIDAVTLAQVVHGKHKFGLFFGLVE